MTYSLSIEGMTCEACAAHVKRSLTEVPGVAEAQVSFAKAEATVIARTGATVTSEALVKAVERAGYKAKVKRQSQN